MCRIETLLQKFISKWFSPNVNDKSQIAFVVVLQSLNLRVNPTKRQSVSLPWLSLFPYLHPYCGPHLSSAKKSWPCGLMPGLSCRILHGGVLVPTRLTQLGRTASPNPPHVSRRRLPLTVAPPSDSGPQPPAPASPAPSQFAPHSASPLRPGAILLSAADHYGRSSRVVGGSMSQWRRTMLSTACSAFPRDRSAGCDADMRSSPSSIARSPCRS